MSGEPDYFVRKTRLGLRCQCEDFVLHKKPCKHIYAAGFFLKREGQEEKLPIILEPKPLPLPPPRKTYKQDWPAYNEYQAREAEWFHPLLAELCMPLEGKRTGPAGGRPRIQIRDAMFAAIFKVNSNNSARRVMPWVRDAKDRGFLGELPSYNSTIRFISQEWLTPLLEELIAQSVRPIRALETDFAVDSTGFGTRTYYKHRIKKRNVEIDHEDHIKLHACVGIVSHAIVAAKVTTRNVNDSPLFPPLFETTAKQFTIREVSADKGYLSDGNVSLVHDRGAKAYILFKRNSREQEKEGAWNDQFRLYKNDPETYLAHYHRRSNVEAVFSALKRRYTDFMRNKAFISQKNELLLKVIAYNLSIVTQLSIEHGLEPSLELVLPKYPQTSPMISRGT